MRFSGFEQMLSHWAAAAPDAPALCYDQEGPQVLTYAELDRMVSARAEELRSSGKTCLGLLADGSLACVITLFASVRAGMQLVMLDAAAPEDLLRALIVYTDIDCLWGDEELAQDLSSALTAGVTDGKGRILFFTSGTTERSKAVVLTEQSLCASAWNGSAKLLLTPQDRLLCLLPLGHVFGFVCGLLWGLSCGACVALGRGARHYADDFIFYRPTAVSVVPLLLGFLIRGRSLNKELKLILVGAGDCPAPLLDAVRAMGKRVSFGYGLTETSSGVAISVGGDPFAMEICPDDEITLADDGEILVSAPTCIMQGYYKRPADTAAVLADGVLHTGDLGRFDDEGRLHITGRKKDVLVLPDGTKLYLPEYEAGICGFLGITDLAVVLRQSRPLLVVGGDGDAAELTEKLLPFQAQLPRGQQLSGVRFLHRPLPRTATGKIKRWELQQYIDNQEDQHL